MFAGINQSTEETFGHPKETVKTSVNSLNECAFSCSCAGTDDRRQIPKSRRAALALTRGTRSAKRFDRSANRKHAKPNRLTDVIRPGAILNNAAQPEKRESAQRQPNTLPAGISDKQRNENKSTKYTWDWNPHKVL